MAPTTRSVCCGACEKKIFRHDDSLSCGECARNYHLICVNVDIDAYLELSRRDELKTWLCTRCKDLTSKSGAEEDAGFGNLGVSGESACNISERNNISDGNVPCREEDANVSVITLYLEDILRRLSEPCSCAPRLKRLETENAELKEIVKLQTEEIRSLKDEMRLFLIEVKASRSGYARVLPEIPHMCSVSDGGGDLILINDESNFESNPSSAATSSQMAVLPAATDVIHGKVTKPSEVTRKSGRNIAKTDVSHNPPANISECPRSPRVRDEGFKIVNYSKKRRAPRLVGSAAGGSFAGAEKMLWKYVGRTSSGTTEHHILGQLKKAFANENFVVSALDSKGNHPSFKVGAPWRLKEDLERPEFWPAGVVVRRFNFKKPDFLRERDRLQGAT